MTLKYLILGGSALLLGFLFFPRGDVVPVDDQDFIAPVRTLNNEPLHYTGILRTDPIVTTYDLGYVYRIDKAEIRFENPDEGGPRQYDILVHTDRVGQRFERAFSYTGSSREYTYPRQAFPLPIEARWVQVVINDWFSSKPQLDKDAFRVGPRYQSHSPILALNANYNAPELQRLTDLLPLENSKWIGAERIENEVKEGDGKKVIEISYKAPTTAIQVIGDLGSNQEIYGVRLTTDGPGNNLKRYYFSVSDDGQEYTEVYVSRTLADEVVTHLRQFDPSISGRYIRLEIQQGDWYGDYPEIREFEVFTDTYRLSRPLDDRLDEYNAVQMHYENLGERGNALAPHLEQGFAFDRDTGDENRYRLLEGSTPDAVDVRNTPSQRSFTYHYDTVSMRFTDLQPSLLYWTKVTYLQEKGGTRIQNLDVDGFLLHEAIALPKGRAQTHTYAIPKESYADGEVVLNFNRLAGPNAAVSEVSIFEANPTTEMAGSTTESTRSDNQTVGRAIRVSQKIVIDGVLDEWPLLYPMLPQYYDSPVDSPVTLYTQWDDENLYVAGIINRHANPHPTPRRSNGNEALHLFVDTTLTRSPGMYTPSEHHFVFTIHNPDRPQPRVHPSQIHHHLDAIPQNIDFHESIEAQATKTETGYVLETRIPKDQALNAFLPAIDSSVGLNYIMMNLELMNGQSGWFAYASDEFTAPPSSWNEVEFVSRISGELVLTDGRADRSISSFNAGDILTLGVWDADRNTDRYQVESIEVELKNSTTGQLIPIVLHEYNPAALADGDLHDGFIENSSLFAAKTSTAYGGNKEDTESTNNSGTADRKTLFVRGGETVSLKYVDPYYSSTARNRTVTITAKVNTGLTGTIAIATESGVPIDNFRLGETLYIQVEDPDLLEAVDKVVIDHESTDPEVDRSILRNMEITVRCIVPEMREVESVTLAYQPERDRYVGSVATGYSEAPTPNNGRLEAAGAQRVAAIYLDEIQITGETDVPVSAQVSVRVGDTGRIELAGMDSRLSLKNRKFIKAGSTLSVFLQDADLNRDDDQRETVDILLNGNRLKDAYQLTLREAHDVPGRFTGTFGTRYATNADTSNSVLEVTGNEVVTVSYIDALAGSGDTQVTVTDTAQVSAGRNGVLDILKANYVTDLENFNAGDRLYFRLHDTDITDEFVEITLVGETLQDQETVQLFQSMEEDTRIYPVEGTFFGLIQTAYGTQRQEKDGILQVKGAERVQAIYMDGLQSTGETNVPLYDTCEANIGITGVLRAYNKRNFDYALAQNLETSSFRAGDTLILEVQDADLHTTDVTVDLVESDFAENVVRDRAGVTLAKTEDSVDTFRGEIQTGYGNTPIPNDDILQVQGEGVVICSYIDMLQNTGATLVPIQQRLSIETGDRGELEIYSADSGSIISGSAVGTGSFNVGEKLRIRLSDKDMNQSPRTPDSAMVSVWGNVVSDGVEIMLRETSINSAVFEGDLLTQKAEPVIIESVVPITTDEVLEITDKEVITVEYIDEITTVGETEVRTQMKAVVLGSSAGMLRIVDAHVADPLFNPEESIPSFTAPPKDFASVHELGSFSAGETLYFWLEDLLLSTVVAADEVKIMVSGDKTRDVVEVVLRRKLGTEGIFTGSVPTQYGTTPVADETLDVQGDEEIRAIYSPNFLGVNYPVVEDVAYTNKGVRGYLAITRGGGTPVRHFNVGSPLHFRLEDADLNSDSFRVESTTVTVVTEAQEMSIKLHEENTNSNIFRGEVSTRYGRAITQESIPSLEGDNESPILGLVGGDTVRAIYADGLTDTGETNVEISASCRANSIAWAPYTNRPVLIDGHEDGWPLERVIKTSQDAGILWLQWDRDHLYLLAQIYDENVVVPDVIEYHRGADAIELHIDLQPDSVKKPSYLQTENNPDRYVIWICPKGGGFHGDRPYIGQGAPDFIPNYQAANLDVAVRQQPNYYVIEARIPFFPVLRGFHPLKTKQRNRIGFNFVIHRSNNEAIYWAAQIPEAGPVFPSDLGLLILESPVP
jgi:hypothetical protein